MSQSEGVEYWVISGNGLVEARGTDCQHCNFGKIPFCPASATPLLQPLLLHTVPQHRAARKHLWILLWRLESPLRCSLKDLLMLCFMLRILTLWPSFELFIKTWTALDWASSGMGSDPISNSSFISYHMRARVDAFTWMLKNAILRYLIPEPRSV